jgi:tetratricopeptide (TPR) repeat protein
MTRPFVSIPIWKPRGTAAAGPAPSSARCRNDCNKALQWDSGNAAAYDSRGLIRLKLGQPGAAIEDYSSAQRIDPKLASALYGRGLARRKTGDQAGDDNDIAAARTIQAGIADDFTRYGVRQRLLNPSLGGCPSATQSTLSCGPDWPSSAQPFGLIMSEAMKAATALEYSFRPSKLKCISPARQ